MKARMLLAAGFAALVSVVVGCNSLPTAQEQFNTFCPIVTADLQTISTSPLLSADQQAVAQKAHDLNAKVCSAGASLDVADLKDLANTTLPAVVTILQAIPVFPQQTAIILAIQTFGPLALQLAEQVATTAQAPASAPTAASAPQ